MKRLMPKETKQGFTLYKGITLKDVGIFVAILVPMLIVVFSVRSMTAMLAFLIYLAVDGMLCFLPILDFKGYSLVALFIKYLFEKKHYPAVKFKDMLKGKIEGNTIHVGEYYSKAIEIDGTIFDTRSENEQDLMIGSFSEVYRGINKGALVRLDFPVSMKDYIRHDEALLRALQAKKASTDEERNAIFARELVISNELNALNMSELKQDYTKARYFLFIYETTKDELNYQVSLDLDRIAACNIGAREVDAHLLREVYARYYNTNFINDEIEFPAVIEGFNTISVARPRKTGDTKTKFNKYRVLAINGVQGLYTGNAWLSSLYSMPYVRIVNKFSNNTDTAKIVKQIDNSILEVKTKLKDAQKQSDINEYENTIDALNDQLADLQAGVETMENCYVYVIYPTKIPNPEDPTGRPIDYDKKIKTVLTSSRIKYNVLFARQVEAYINAGLYLPNIKTTKSAAMTLTTSTLSSTFPFIYPTFLDKGGDFIGTSYGNPVFFNLFANLDHLSNSRQSANMVILGKTGGGKSFASKKMLLERAKEGNRIYILDPDNEYHDFAQNLFGNYVDVGGNSYGMINPLQVFEELQEDEDGGATANSVTQHRIFLETFFEVVLGERLNDSCFPKLNSLLLDLYESFGIFDGKPLPKDPTAYPTLDDLYNLCATKLEYCEKRLHDKTLGSSAIFSNDVNYHYETISTEDVVQYRQILNCLSDLKTGGIMSTLWNGYTTLKITNDMTVFNFQKLLQNQNKRIVNGQILLLMRFLHQEIINNKNNNALLDDLASKSSHPDSAEFKHQRVVIFLDEAHQFIDPKKPIALSFMKDMIKRIRKYDGSMIVATQNILDFIGGSEETKRDASAVINGAQYMLIFGLLPNDLNSLKDMFKACELTEAETDYIKSARTGEGFFVIDPNTRAEINIVARRDESMYWENKNLYKDIISTNQQMSGANILYKQNDNSKKEH